MALSVGWEEKLGEPNPQSLLLYCGSKLYILGIKAGYRPLHIL
jgi:hypothetical protein